MIEYLPVMCKTLGLIPALQRTNKQKPKQISVSLLFQILSSKSVTSEKGNNLKIKEESRRAKAAPAADNLHTKQALS
jgi:hypothetical protein